MELLNHSDDTSKKSPMCYLELEAHQNRSFLNEKNINNPSITLNFKNLEALCLDCHNKIHFGDNKRRYIVDELGNIKGIDSPPV